MGSVLYLQKEPRARSSAAPETLLRPAYNCSAVAHAPRAAVLIDAAAYFKAFHDAALRAQRSIYLMAWDFNSRTRLHFDPVEKDGPPALLGDFLNFLVRRRRGLHIHILNWDYPMVFGTDREFPPIYGFGWTPARHVHLRYDDTHPIAGCQHQKIAVIDDAVAFVGGIDLTVRRYDCPDHRPDDPRRVAYEKPYPPFHDLMVALDGDAARYLAGVARERWHAATGERLKPPVGVSGDPWPEGVEPAMRDVEVGIARTMPPKGEVPALREIEKLYLDTIAHAQHTIYIENQYFTSQRIAAEVEKRLAERDGPEVVLVLRLLSHGWLEEHTMHVLRTRLVQRLLAADRYGRFHVYYPYVPGLAEGCCLDVHSKLMIADDRMLQIGSANICNRSMALDSECDVVIEARGRPEVARAISDVRNKLLGEHLGMAPETVADAVARAGSLHGAIETLGPQGDARTLKPFEDLKEWPEAIVELAAVADPEEPIAPDFLSLERFSEYEKSGEKPAWAKLALIAGAFLLLAAIWRFTPLAGIITAENTIAWAHDFGTRWWAPLATMAVYTPACFTMFPRPLITLFAVVAFGPWLGALYALVGIVSSAVVTYFVGRGMRRDTVRRLAGPKLDQIVAVLKKHGLLAMTLLRLVPLAPFAVEGIVAGAVRLKLWHLAVGTAIGMLPGTLATTIFGDQLETALSGSGSINWWVVGGVLALLLAGAVAVKRWFSRMAAKLPAQ